MLTSPPANVEAKPSASQTDKITTVTWAKYSLAPESDMSATAITLIGTITVAIAATALFATFVLSGITFSLVSPGGAGATSFNFTYTGTKSAAYIQGLLVAGANITFNA